MRPLEGSRPEFSGFFWAQARQEDGEENITSWQTDMPEVRALLLGYFCLALSTDAAALPNGS